MEETDFADITRLGALLRRFRLAAGFTQGSLAEKAGVGIRTIQDLELGTHQPRPKTVQRLVRALELSVDRQARVAAVAQSRPRRSPRVPVSLSSSKGLLHLASSSGDGPSGIAPRSNLPASWSTFVGRESELRDVAELLGRARLVTLTGAGGVGKSRLALEAARAAVGEYRDGVWLVELAALADLQFVVGAVARALGLEDQQGQPLIDRLLNQLRYQRVLLVLDNCEHVIDACADLVRAVLGGCPGIAILTTSREALRLPGENVFRVPSLPVPSPDQPVRAADLARYGAIRLFADRAREGSGFVPTEANAGAVARICRDLDGIPLAIELAAARLSALSVEQIADLLGQQRRLLSVGHRTALSRQQTMQATIDWSYDLLTEAERRVWHRLAVFSGGFTLEAAAEVLAIRCRASGKEPSGLPSLTPAEDVLDLIARLVDKSLVVREDRAGTARYRLLEPLRQYAGQKLEETGEADVTRDRHLEWCLALTKIRSDGYPEMGPTASNEQFALENDNMRAALAWCVDHDPTRGLRLARNLGTFWGSWGLDPEGQHWRDAFLARTTVESSERAWALYYASIAARDFGDYPTATARIREGLATARKVGDEAATSCALWFSGVVASDQGEYAEGKVLLKENLQLAHVIGSRAAADARFVLAEIAIREGDYVSARAIVEEFVADGWVRANASYAAVGLRLLGAIAHATGDLTRARALLEESVGFYRDVVDRPSEGIALAYLGYVMGSSGDYARAAALHREALTLFQKLNHRPRAALTMFFMGLVALRSGAFERGVTLIAAAQSTPGFLRTLLDPSQRADRAARLVVARDALGGNAFDRSWATGSALGFDGAVAFGLATEGVPERDRAYRPRAGASSPNIRTT